MLGYPPVVLRDCYDVATRYALDDADAAAIQ